MNRTSLFRILIICAGVMGADGVILAAASAHQPDASRLASASSMLLFHAAAVLGAVALIERGIAHLQIGLASAWGLVIGASICRPRPVSHGRADRRHAADRQLDCSGGICGMAEARLTLFARPAPIS
jgi:hypothetical protein